MLDLLKSLYLHQEWADAALLNAVRAGAPGDDNLRALLHHIVSVQHVLFSFIVARPFDQEVFNKVPDSLDEVRAAFQRSHSEMLAFLDRDATRESLARTVQIPFFKNNPNFIASDVLLQIALHSQNHRGQCLTQLRLLGARPPVLDFILWTQNRPAPAW